MDLEHAIKVVEGYAKSYIHYILGFFGNLREQTGDIASSGKGAPALTLDDGSLLIFGFFNALVGAALQGLFMQQLQFADINFPQAVIVEVCYWLLLSIILHVVLNLWRETAHFGSALTAILRVLPVAYVIGAYASFVAYFVALAFLPGDVAPLWAAGFFAAVEVLFLIWFLPRAAAEIPGPSRLRTRIASGVVIAVVSLVHLLVLIVSIADHQERQAAQTEVASRPLGMAVTLVLAALILAAAPQTAWAQDPAAAAVAPAAAASPGPPATSPPPPAPAAAIAPEPSGIAQGQLVQRAWRWASRQWDRAFNRNPPQDRSLSPAPPPPTLARPRYETLVLPLAASASDADLTAADLRQIEAAAQYALYYASPRVLVEVLPSPDLPTRAALQDRAAQVREALVARGVEPAKVLVEFRRHPRMTRARPFMLSVFF